MSDRERVVAAVDDFEEGEVRRVEVNGRGVAVARVGDEFHAVSDACPHKGARFSLVGDDARGDGGTLGELDADACTIKCPYHYWEFDLRTGDVAGSSKKRVPTFETTVSDGDVSVRLR